MSLSFVNQSSLFASLDNKLYFIGKIFHFLRFPERFCQSLRSWGPPSLLCNGHRVSLPKVKRPGRGVEQPPHLAPRLKKLVELYICSSCGPSWPVLECVYSVGTLKYTTCFNGFEKKPSWPWKRYFPTRLEEKWRIVKNITVAGILAMIRNEYLKNTTLTVSSTPPAYVLY